MANQLETFVPAALTEAWDLHSALIARKCAALGLRVGSADATRILGNDLDVLESHRDTLQIARDFAIAFDEVDEVFALDAEIRHANRMISRAYEVAA